MKSIGSEYRVQLLLKVIDEEKLKVVAEQYGWDTGTIIGWIVKRTQPANWIIEHLESERT